MKINFRNSQGGEVIDAKNALNNGTLFTIFLLGQENVKPIPLPSH
jgi:hypothetical protein